LCDLGLFLTHCPFSPRKSRLSALEGHRRVFSACRIRVEIDLPPISQPLITGVSRFWFNFEINLQPLSAPEVDVTISAVYAKVESFQIPTHIVFGHQKLGPIRNCPQFMPRLRNGLGWKGIELLKIEVLRTAMFADSCLPISALFP
jgi:hypothetical protein